MKKRLNSSILAATSLTAITIQHQTDASTLVPTESQLSALSNLNQLEASDVTTLDFSNMTPEIVSRLRLVSIDLSQFQNVRNIILPWYATNLGIKLPQNFNTPLNDSYSRLKIISAGVAPSSDSDLTLNLGKLLKGAGSVILDTKAVPVTTLTAGESVAKIERNNATTNLTVPDTLEALDTDGVIPSGTKTSITITPTVVVAEHQKAPYIGLPTAVLAADPSSLDISAYSIAGKDVSLSGMSNITNLITASGDSIGSLKVTGDTSVTTNAASINKIEFTSTAPKPTVVATMSAIANVNAPTARDAHIASFVGKTELDFSKLDLGSIDTTATRIKDILDSATPITSIVSMKISRAVLAAVMTKLNITNLSGFSALKRLDIVSSNGTYQTTTLASTDLPSSLEEFYASNLVVRKGTLSADLEFDSKFSAATLDLSGLDVNGHALTIAGSFTASSVNTLKLNPSLLAVAATKNLISISSSKSIVVSGAASGALTTTNLQNVGTIDLGSVTGATSFSNPLNVDGNNSNLSSLYLPSAFDVEVAADILSGVDNGEVTVYLSGTYSGAKTLDASYDKTILNFTNVTGTGRFQLPAGVRGLILSNAVKGINVGAAAVLNEFDFSGLTHIRQITDLPTSTTVLKLNNTSASAALQLNLTALTSLTTLQLGNSRISQLSLPASATLTDGGEAEHLDLSNVTDLAQLNGLNALLAEESITQVSFPNNPASTLRINLVDTIPGLQFNNLDKIPELTVDSDYSPGENMWPTVKSKSSSADWSNFFNYIIATVPQGGINSPSIFDLSGQAIENQVQADALVIALNNLSQASKSVIQKIVIRLDAASSGAIDFSGIVTTDFSHGSLKIIIDQSTGSTATVSVPAGWSAKTKTYLSLGQVSKTTPASWTNYLNYRFASLNDKGEAATSLDLSSIDLTAAQWSALMTSLNSFATPEAIETISLKLVAANDYSSAPAFTSATLSAATSIIVDVTGVKNSGAQVTVTGLPSATINLQVEQRVTAAASVDRETASSWKGYLEYLLSNISGSNYTLDLTASNVQIQTAAQLTALNSALAGLSTANKLKIKNVKLKIATGNRAANFTVSTDFTGFTNLTSVVVDTTGALNGTAQSTVTFSLTNAPAYAKAHVTSLASVDTDVAASWEYYFAYRLATDGVGLTNLDVSSISLAAQTDLTAFLTALESQSGGDKSSVQSIKLKLDSNYDDSTVDFSVDLGDGEISGLDHGSFAVEVDRNGANSTAPVSFAFGTAITASNTTIKDTAFTGLGSFDGTDAHQWLGYVRALLSTIASGTTTLDLSIHSALEMNNAKVAKFIAGMNALPASDKEKVATLKIKLSSGNFGAATADLSGLSGFSVLTSLVVERNGARTSATLYDPAVSVTGPGTVTINDPELRSISLTTQTNEWLGYLRFVLNGMFGITNTVDLSAFAINTANAATAINNALESLPASEKLKVQTLKLSASAAVALGTGVSGFTSLIKVIVDQTAAPSAAITIAGGFGTTQKFYVTSASAPQTSEAWAKYIDYVMSSVANGGLNQTAFDLTGLTLDNDQLGYFLTALDGYASAASVSGLTLKLAPTFGSGSLNLSGYTNLSDLGADSVVIYRNSASVDGAGSSTPVTVTYGGSFTDTKVKLIDPTATTIADQTKAQDWLKYLTYVTSQSMFDATSGFGAQNGVLDLSSLPLASSGEVVGLITALELLDSSLKAKLKAIDVKLASGNFGAETLALSGDLRISAGFTHLTKFMVDATGTETNAAGTQKVLDFSALSIDGSKDMWVTSLAAVDYNSANAAASWLAYIHYQIRNNDTDFALDTSAINGGAGLTVDQAGYLFDALETLSATGTNKERLTSVAVKLATTPGAATLTIDQDLSALTGLTSIVVNVTDIMYSGTQVAVDFGDGMFPNTTTKKALVSSLSSVDKDNQNSWTYYFNTAAMTSIDVSSITLTSAEASAFLAALGTGITAKADITSLTMKLAPAFGAASLSLDGTGLTGLQGADRVTIQRNGALNAGVPVLVSLNNGLTGSHVRVVDPTAGTVTSQASSQDWLKYLTGVLNDADTEYVLDLRNRTLSLTTHIDAINAALNALDSSLKDKVSELWLTVTADGELGTGVSGFTSLIKVIVDQTAAPSAAITIAADTVATDEFNDAATKKFFVTSASAPQTSEAWAKYIDYVMSSVANGGLNQRNFDLTGLTLDNDQLGYFLTALDGYASAASVSGLTLKLATAFGSGSLNLSGYTNLSDLGADSVVIYRNAATHSGAPVTITYGGSLTDSVVQIIDPTAGTVADQTSAQDWLKYLTGVLNDADTEYVLDLRNRTLSASNHIDAINAALNALDSSLKDKVAELWLTVTADGALGTGVSGFTSLIKVIVDQTAAPSAAITIAADTVATDEFNDASTQKFYVTSADVAKDNNAWAKYIDYAMSIVADGGLNQTAFDLTGLTLTNAQVGQFLSALDGYASAASVSGLTLKLATAFGSGSLNLSGYTNLSGLGADSVVIYRNAATHSGAPVTITYGGSLTDSVVQIIDPTATTIADTAEAQQWLGYLTGVLNDTASGATLDLSSIAIDDAQAVTAFNAAIKCLDSALSSKVAVLKLNITHTANIDLGTGSSGFSNLSRIEFTKPASNTVAFADALAGKRTYLTSFNSVKMDTEADWVRYLNYMLSTIDGGQSASSLNLNSRTFANQTAVDAFFAGLNVLNAFGFYGDKAALTTLRMKLADALSNVVIGGSDTVATGLAAELRVIVDPGTSTGTTHAGSAANTVQADNLIVLDSTPAFSKNYFAYIAEQNGFAGTVDLTGLDLTNAGTNTLIQELNLLSADTKSAIKTINLKLQSGNFGTSTLSLGALTGFTGVTFNIDRNSAIDGNNAYGPLVTFPGGTGYTVNLTDAEFHNMSTFDNESSANWIGYLTHELNSAPASYTLDLTVHPALMLDSTNSVSAFSHALRYLPNTLKTKVALLKVKSSTSGDFGATDGLQNEAVIQEYAAFDNLASVAIEFTATNLTMGTYIGSLDINNNHKYFYISTPFNGMNVTDWTRFFDYQLNPTNIGGLGATDIVLNQRLSSADITAVLAGLGGATTGKASLQNLTLNLASDVVGDINVGASGLTALTTVTINTNGSVARLTPADDFYDKTILTSVLNVNPAVQGSWRAYLKGQSSIAAIDIREVELANQAELTAFLTALDAESRKATVDTLKIKLASSYAGTASFATVNPSGLTALDNAGVEIHRNGSAATAVEGGSITNAKIKIVDLTADSLTDRSSSESWRRYLTALIEDGAFAGSIDLALDSDTYLRTNAHVTAFMTALQNLSPANKLLVTSLKLELAAGAAWSNITDLGQGLSGFDNLTSFIVDATGAYTSAGGNPQVTVAFHADLTAASPKVIVSSLNSVDKDSQDSWTYYFNSGAMTSVDVSSITLNDTEASAFLGAIGTGVTAKANITSLTMKLDPTFGAASLTVDETGFSNLAPVTVTVHRNGATDSGLPVEIILSDNTASLNIIDPTISDADSVLKTSASSWLAYLTHALDGVVTELDLTDDNLVLGTAGQATALSRALDALDSSLKTKIEILKVKAATNVTIDADLTAGFNNIIAIELDKPAANTITFSNVDSSTHLRIADLANVKRTDSNDWLAYIQYLMKDLGAVTNFDLDMTASPLADGEAQAFVAALVTISDNANGSGNSAKIQKVRLKLAPGAWSGNFTDVGIGWNVAMDNINTFTVDATGATVSGTQLFVGFHANLTAQSEYTKAFVTDLNSVDKGNADAWEFYLNHLTKDGPAALDLSGTTLSYVELNALDNGLGTFSTAAGNGNKLSSIHIKVSGAAGVSNYAITADLDPQTTIDSAAKFIVDVSGFTHAGTQATVSHTGGTTKAVELRISGASDLYRNSSASWGMYLNSVYAGGIPGTSTVDLTSSSSLYLRSQADVDALMTAIQARSDKGNITTLNVRLAQGSVGSDIIFGTGVTGINPTMNITATGATNNGTLITSSDIHYAGSFTSAGKTVTQAFATTVVNKAVQADWTKYLTYVLSSVDAGGLGHASIVAPALTASGELTALMNALRDLSSNELKASIQHIHLDVSAFDIGSSDLGIGVTGLTNLQEVTYIRSSGAGNAAESGSFVGKLQRLRTALNAHTLASAATIGSYLRYKLMDPEMGGEGLTVLDLTSQALTSAQAVNLNTALGALPDDLSFRITELRLNLNAAGAVTFDAAGLRNLATVKYFQTGAGALTWTVADGVGFGVTTPTRFRALLADVTNKADQDEWSEYIDYALTSVNDGGLGQTTLDLSSITLTSAQVIKFLAALNAHASAANVTALTLKLDPTFGAASLDLSGYSNLDGLGADSVTIHRNAAVNTGAPVTITYGGSFTDANVKIIDPETNTTADKDNTRQQWLEYLTYTINTVGLTSGLLTIAPGDAFTAQSQIYALFDAMEALDPSLKDDVVTISIDISSIAGGTVLLKRTDDVALTGFSNLTKVIYKRGGIDTDILAITTNLNTQLDTALAAANTPNLDGGWPYADNAALLAAVDTVTDHGDVKAAITGGDAENLKSVVITRLADGIPFPPSNVCDAAVDAAAADVDVTVDLDQKLTLATALTPFRSTGKISAIKSALTTAFTNGGTTGLGTLPWLKSAWGAYTNHTDVMTAVLADGTVSSAIGTDGQTIADIKTAVSAKLNSMLIPTSGQIDTLITAIDLTALAGWNSNADTFVSDLRNRLNTDLNTLMPWFDTTDTVTDPDVVNDFISSTIFNLTVYFGGTTPVAGKWDLGNSGLAIKTQIAPDLKSAFGAVVTPGATSAAGRLTSAIDDAFTAADSGNALTTNTAAWVRPTAGIESALTSLIEGALNAFDWYTGVAATQAAAAVTAGDVANQNAATIISNIKTYLTNNVSRPTANSIFAAGVSDAVDAISLAATSTAVTTDFAGVSETLSRYRVAVADVTDKENPAQWTEYLLHKLAPVTEGGLYATEIDISAAPLNNDQKTNFMVAFAGLPDNLRLRVTSIKLAAADNTLGNLDGGGKAYNDNLKIIMVMDSFANGSPTLYAAGGQEFYAANGTTQLLSADVIDYRITATPAVSATAVEWTRWLNHQLSTTFGGASATSIDLSATREFTSQAQLNTFFAGLEALDGSTGLANKNLLESLTLKLAAGDFGAASVRIGYTGSAAVTGLKSDIAVTIQRNGAQDGTNSYDPLVTINHADIDALSSVDGVTVDNTDAVDVDDLSSSAEWLEYLNSTLTAAGAAYTLDLTGAGLILQAGTSATEATALFNALQALNPTLKAKIATIKIKLAAGDHGLGALALSGTLDAAAGFSALARIIVDVTEAQTNVGGTQKIINWAGVTTEAAVKKVMWVTDIDKVDFDSGNATDSWHAYLNFITRTGNAALDTSSVNSGNGLTVAQAAYVFNALENFSAANDNAARLTGVTVKLIDNADADSGTLAVTQDLRNLSGLASIIVDATNAQAGGDQVIVNFSGVNFHANTTTKEARVTDLASVDLDSVNSWAYYLNYLKATNGNIASIDLSARDLYETNQVTTQSNLDAFFTALDASDDKATVKDIYFNICGVDNLALNVGTGSTGLTALTSVVIKRHAGAGSTFSAAGDVAAADLAVINSATGTLGASGTVAQWKGYLAYLLEDAAHGGAYTGSNPIALNLTDTALQVNSLAVLQAIETAIAELPARLKARISASLIKTTDTSVDYTSGAAYEFGDAFATAILSELSNLKVVIIESCTTGTPPVFDTNGDFFNAMGISKIIYQTTINIA